jgi:hypothetical protein
MGWTDCPSRTVRRRRVCAPVPTRVATSGTILRLRLGKYQTRAASPITCAWSSPLEFCAGRHTPDARSDTDEQKAVRQDGLVQETRDASYAATDHTLPAPPMGSVRHDRRRWSYIGAYGGAMCEARDVALVWTCGEAAHMSGLNRTTVSETLDLLGGAAGIGLTTALAAWLRASVASPSAGDAPPGPQRLG